jgi:hypothetical protein
MPIKQKKLDGWVAQFGAYRRTITSNTIESWIQQFDVTHDRIAENILEKVTYFTNERVTKSYREMLNGIVGWSNNPNSRQGKWFFVPFSGSAGQSGDSMTYVFRHANNLNHKSHEEMFIHRSELVSKAPGPNDTVVLIDDFSGTGDQACEAWEAWFSELFPNSPRIILMLVAATDKAISRIRATTNMQPVCHTVFTARQSVFDSKCKWFSESEKKHILKYCMIADKQLPLGKGNAALLVSFYHNCPNNSLPILHVDKAKWRGLFPRQE